MTDFADWYEIRVRAGERPHSLSKFDMSKQWCETEFGDRWELDNRQGRWRCFWCGPRDHDHYRFSFRNSEDAALFALRWS